MLSLLFKLLLELASLAELLRSRTTIFLGILLLLLCTLKPKTLGTYVAVGTVGTSSSKVIRKMCAKDMPKYAPSTSISRKKKRAQVG